MTNESSLKHITNLISGIKSNILSGQEREKIPTLALLFVHYKIELFSILVVSGNFCGLVWDQLH